MDFLAWLGTGSLAGVGVAVLSSLVAALYKVFTARRESQDIYKQERDIQIHYVTSLGKEIMEAAKDAPVLDLSGSVAPVGTIEFQKSPTSSSAKRATTLNVLAARTAANRLKYIETDDTLVTLRAYFRSNLGQVNTIFWVSVVAMLIGFVTIMLSFRADPTFRIPTIVAGVVSQFIAATFLIVYKSAVTQATAFSETLERLRLANLRSAERALSVQAGIEIIDDIQPDLCDLKSQTMANAALLLIAKQRGWKLARPLGVSDVASDGKVGAAGADVPGG